MMNYKEQVYFLLTQIPKGKVVTYGQIAEQLGSRHLARAVGNILRENSDGDIYPCYKVVNARGCLSENYAFGGMKKQKERLENDGIFVEGNKVDLRIYQYKF